MSKKKKNLNRTKYGDYSVGALSADGIKVHVFIYSVVSLFVLSFITFSITNGRIWLPKRHGALYFDGTAMYTVIASLILMVIGFYLPVIEFYSCKSDFHKSNIIRKRFFMLKKWNKTIAWTLFVLSIVIGILNNNISKV
jgi:hypothetical protein